MYQFKFCLIADTANATEVISVPRCLFRYALGVIYPLFTPVRHDNIVTNINNQHNLLHKSTHKQHLALSSTRKYVFGSIQKQLYTPS